MAVKRISTKIKIIIGIAGLALLIGVPLTASAIQNFFVGGSRIIDFKLGDRQVSRVYLGNNLVWERTDPMPADPGTALGPLQSLTVANCPSYTAARSTRTAFDARNSQIYYVGKVGTTCWMMSNLRYGGDGNWKSAWGWADDRYATTTSNSTASTNDNARALTPISGSTPTSFTIAQYVNPGGSADYTNIALNGGFYGYLYNWCAAMGGQPNACNDTSTTGFNTSMSICPAGWRLPGGGASATTTGNDFGVLNTAINSGSTSNDSGLRTNFLSVYSGYHRDHLNAQNERFYAWSSTVYSNTGARPIIANQYGVYPGTDYNPKRDAYAIRCILK